jgi:hypothetical protein
MTHKEGYEPDKQKRTEGYFHDPCSNALHRRKLGPINFYFLGHLVEQIA